MTFSTFMSVVIISFKLKLFAYISFIDFVIAIAHTVIISAFKLLQNYYKNVPFPMPQQLRISNSPRKNRYQLKQTTVRKTGSGFSPSRLRLQKNTSYKFLKSCHNLNGLAKQCSMPIKLKQRTKRDGRTKNLTVLLLSIKWSKAITTHYNAFIVYWCYIHSFWDNINT